MVYLSHKGLHTLYLLTTKLLTIYMNSIYRGTDKGIAAILLTLIAIVIIYTIGGEILDAVDRITVRDCERGITSACQYVK